MKLLICAVMCVIGLAACKSQSRQEQASVSPEEARTASCTGVNWHEVGETVAGEGKHVRSFDAFVERCGDSLPDTAKSQYIAGYTSGIMDFCTQQNGYNLGLESKDKSSSCPPELRNDFRRGYNIAQQEIQQTMHQIERDTDRRQNNEMKDATQQQQEPTR